MTKLQFLTSKEFGCCTIAELMALSKQDKEALNKLKEYAADEMKRRGIEITEQL